MKSINTAIIGFGLAGRVFHAPIINSIQEFNLKKIYTTNLENINYMKETYPKTSAVSNVEEILNDETIELVVIATPNTSHYSLAKDMLKAKKNVVVDKPFTINSFEADELINLAQEKNVVLSVFQNRRWDSDFKTVKKIVASNMLGNLVECEIHMDRFRNYLKKNSWREENLPGSGNLYDLGSHLIDQAVTLFGLPMAITADLRKQRKDAKEVDNIELILHYEKLKVTLKAGMLVRIPLPKFILLGENGSFVKYGMDVQEEDLTNGYTPLNKKDWGQEPEESFGKILTTVDGITMNGKIESEKGDYREYYKNIYNAITQGGDLAVTPQQARNTIKMIEYAMKSNETRSTIHLEGLYPLAL